MPVRAPRSSCAAHPATPQSKRTTSTNNQRRNTAACAWGPVRRRWVPSGTHRERSRAIASSQPRTGDGAGNASAVTYTTGRCCVAQRLLTRAHAARLTQHDTYDPSSASQRERLRLPAPGPSVPPAGACAPLLSPAIVLCGPRNLANGFDLAPPLASLPPPDAATPSEGTRGCSDAGGAAAGGAAKPAGGGGGNPGGIPPPLGCGGRPPLAISRAFARARATGSESPPPAGGGTGGGGRPCGGGGRAGGMAGGRCGAAPQCGGGAVDGGTGGRGCGCGG